MLRKISNPVDLTSKVIQPAITTTSIREAPEAKNKNSHTKTHHLLKAMTWWTSKINSSVQ